MFSTARLREGIARPRRRRARTDFAGGRRSPRAPVLRAWLHGATRAARTPCPAQSGSGLVRVFQRRTFLQRVPWFREYDAHELEKRGGRGAEG